MNSNKSNRNFTILLIHTLASIAYVIYMFFSYINLGNRVLNPNDPFETLGNALLAGAVAKLTLPHTWVMLLAAVFSLVGLFIKRPWAYLTAAIIQIVAAFMYLPSIVFLVILIILGFVAYSILKKGEPANFISSASSSIQKKQYGNSSQSDSKKIINILLLLLAVVVAGALIFYFANDAREVGKPIEEDVVQKGEETVIVTPIEKVREVLPTKEPQKSSDGIYDIGIPNLNGQVYYENDMNLHVFWVQHQLKATNKYYQGDNWDETGNLGDYTMSEISRFMKANGYSSHSGRVDQNVVNTLADYLGGRTVPVYIGGFYEKMNSIMVGGAAGSMEDIDENSSSRRIEWVQRCLSKLGYYNNSIDGKFGPRTISALKDFQEEHDFVRRDYVSLGVARAMLEECYRRGYSLNDLP